MMEQGHGVPLRNNEPDRYCLAPLAKRGAAKPPQQLFVATMLDDGTISLEIPGTAGHSRRKLNTSFGLDAAIRNELEWQSQQNRWHAMEAANKQAAAESAQRQRNEQYLAAVHNRTSGSPPAPKRLDRATTILTQKLGPTIVRSMQERGELRILVKSPPRPAFALSEFSHDDVGV